MAAGQLTSVGLDALPGRDLEPEELRELVVSLAADPDQWAHLVGFDDDERVYASLHRDTHVDVWLLCWTPVNDTGWHDHDISSGAVAVVAGELVENNLRVGSPSRETGSVRASRSRSAPTTSTGSTAPSAARCPCTPTARRCGGWGSTPSTTTECCAGCRCRTPTSCARSSRCLERVASSHQPQEPGTPLKGPTTRLVTQPP